MNGIVEMDIMTGVQKDADDYVCLTPGAHFLIAPSFPSTFDEIKQTRIKAKPFRMDYFAQG